MTLSVEKNNTGPGEAKWVGIVRYLHRTPRAFLPMLECSDLTLVEGKGVVGDRYMIGAETGYYSHMPEEGRQVTLFEYETLEALSRDAGIQIAPSDHRRNITVQGVPLNHLVGKQFWLGDALLEATRLSTPCKHIEEILGKPVFNPLINRAGLNCKIIKGAVVRVGDFVRGG